MSFHQDEYLPPEVVISTVVREALKPTLVRVAKEVGESVAVRVEAHAKDAHSAIGIASSDGQDHPRSGVARIRVRHTARRDRDLYCVQALFDSGVVASGTGFSGFTLAGELLTRGGEVTVTLKAQTFLYNDHHWRGWFW